MKPPEWWSENLDESKNAPTRVALRTAGRAYGSLARLNERITTAYQCAKPVICVGNFTVGGAGKTPLAIALAKDLKTKGKSAAFLTRGYGGTTTGPHMLDADTDTATTVGDEPFLLAEHGPVMISADRAAGARILELVDCDVIIMDDGFQNPALHRNLSIIIADASIEHPFGNKEVMPAGPLRAPLDWQTAHADAIVVVSENADDVRQTRDDLNFDRAMFRATISPAPLHNTISQSKIIAFCGIGKPEKFFQTLADLELDVAAHIAFDDHHPFSDDEAAELVERAMQSGAQLLTTTKDAARIRLQDTPSSAMQKLVEHINELEVELKLIPEDQERFDRLIASAINR